MTAGPSQGALHIGAWRVTALCDGYFKLDGGAMWGVVPATLWRPMTAPDAENRIRLALRCFLAERGSDKVVIEGGIGRRWSAKQRAIYAIEEQPTLERSLAAAGVRPEEITHVVLSHCHWDHAGGVVVERGGRATPLFPNARHFAPAVEVANALNPDHVRRASYRREDIEPLLAANLLGTYEGSAELLPGLRAHVLGGHSDGVSVITLDEHTDDGAVFWSDVVPTKHHVQPAYIMAYDIDVARSYAQRSQWIARAAERRWAGLFYHDEHVAFARIERDGKRYAARAIGGNA